MLSAILVAMALTIVAAGHGNATRSVVDLAEVALHAQAAGIWVDGLVVLVVPGRSLGRAEVGRFAALALTSVLAAPAGAAASVLHSRHSRRGRRRPSIELQ